jgi:ankyrin repeat protein
VAAQDECGLTPLHLASQQGHLNLARFLVKHGANAAAQDERGSTPLHLASQQGHLNLARFLVKHGASAVAQATPQIQQSTIT